MTMPDAKPPAGKYTASAPIYLDTQRFEAGDELTLTASQAQRLGSLVTPASPASAAKPAASGS